MSQLFHNTTAVIVTHNRIGQLKLVVDAARKQTVQISQVIIVNNQSTDGTTEWLATQPDLKMILQDNTGGAGGFRTGIQEAMNTEASWIWLLDDDIAPLPDCLENLLAYSDRSKCIQPVRLGENDRMLDEERYLDEGSATIFTSRNRSFRNGKDFIETNLGCFEGMLIHRDVVSEIGLPDERFFLAHDDLVYGYLASKHTNLVITQKAIARKLPSSFGRFDSLSYLYYSMRNLWLVNDYLSRYTPLLYPYRLRRIRLQFFKAAVNILRRKNYESKRSALKTLFKAYQDYKLQKTGKIDND